jgi:mRNA-degrading endonuclease RelE of RelBE toxin-antitoxin system
MREWRILYVVDDEKHLVTVRGVVHRRDAYRSH